MIKKILLVSLTILWMSVIFIYSNQQDVTSDKVSGSFINNTIVRIYKVFNSDASEKEIETVLSFWNYPVRKVAHFTEYLILGILAFFTLKEFGVKNIYVMFLLCFLYAYSDEFHQLFVVGRNGNFFDVILDTFGSITGIIIFHKIYLK
ncbi:MAG: VanZ family protein [Bacilli bacterium]|nr:VanZ family protein [Bacilli bacterium]